MANSAASTIGIVIGVVVGLVAIAITLIIIICCFCGRKRRHSRSKFEQFTPSKDSTPKSSLAPPINDLPHPGHPVLLPKVSSTGLWMSNSSMMAPTPNAAYFSDQNGKPLDYSHLPLYRATSEPKIINGPGSAYQGNLRIYHSQQLHSQQLPPLYEVYDPRSRQYEVMVPISASRERHNSRDFQSQPILLDDAYFHEAKPANRRKVERANSDGRDKYSFNKGDVSRDASRPAARPRSGDLPYRNSRPYRNVLQVNQPPARNSEFLLKPAPKTHNDRERESSKIASLEKKFRNREFKMDQTFFVRQHPQARHYKSAIGIEGVPFISSRPTNMYYTHESLNTSPAYVTNPAYVEENGTRTTSGYDSARSNKIEEVEVDDHLPNGTQTHTGEADLKNNNNESNSVLTKEMHYALNITQPETKKLDEKLIPDCSLVPSPSDHMDAEGKHISAAFHFLDSYLSDEERSVKGDVERQLSI